MRSNEPTRTVLITTAGVTIWSFFRQQILDLSKAGFRVSTICSPDQALASCRAELGIDMHEVSMRRAISPLRDLGALIRLYWILRSVRAEIVHTHTPKAGLLGMIAAFLARVPVRIYTVNGLVWETSRGLRRRVLQSADAMAARLATEVVCVSPSVRDAVVLNGICPAAKAKVLGCGASHGIDLKKFDPARFTRASRAEMRSRYGIPQEARLIGFVGRVVRDKGIEDLAAAWEQLRAQCPGAYLILIGTREPGDPVGAATLAALSIDPRVAMTDGIVEDMPAMYSMLDLCVLPTHREGLPNVALEAAAMGVALVATRVTGCVDVVRDGETGLLVEPRQPAQLSGAVRRLMENPKYAARLAAQGRAYVCANFSEQAVSTRLAAEYQQLLSGLDAHRPTPDLKRFLDLSAAAVALIALAPVMAVCALAIRRALGTPVLFRQSRIGYRDRPFTILKFRTMSNAVDPLTGRLLPDSRRLSAVGRFVRRTSLDELPQLWNVLIGQMSLVGPRPLLPQYLPRYSALQRRRHEVRPGITGWAQVNGRNRIDWDTRLALDVWYVDHRSLALDLRILWRTAWSVLASRSVAHPEHATMPEFLGQRGAEQDAGRSPAVQTGVFE